jgi:hypothetical protein
VGQKYYVSVWWCRYDCTTVWLRKKKCFMLVGSTNFAASLVRRITWSDHVNNKDMFYCSDRIRFGLKLKIQIRSDPTMFCILAIEWSWVIFIVDWKKNTLPYHVSPQKHSQCKTLTLLLLLLLHVVKLRLRYCICHNLFKLNFKSPAQCCGSIYFCIKNIKKN